MFHTKGFVHNPLSPKGTSLAFLQRGPMNRHKKIFGGKFNESLGGKKGKKMKKENFPSLHSWGFSLFFPLFHLSFFIFELAKETKNQGEDHVLGAGSDYPGKGVLIFSPFFFFFAKEL